MDGDDRDGWADGRPGRGDLAPTDPAVDREHEHQLVVDDGRPPATLDRARTAVEGVLGGRPLGAVAVLVAGGVVLLALLGVVLATTGDDDGTDRPTCLLTNADTIREAIAAGEVTRLRISLPRGEQVAAPIAIDVDLADGTCRSLPQGDEGRTDRERVVGMAYTFNQGEGDQRPIALSVSEIDVPEEDPPPIFVPPPVVPGEPPPTATEALPPAASPAPPIASPTVAATPS